MTGTDREPPRRLARLLEELRHVVRAVVLAVRKFGQDRGPQLAAAVAYRVLFSLVPLLTLIVSIIGLLLKNEQRRNEVTEYILDSLPLAETAQLDVERYLTEIPHPASAAGVVSILILFWAASGMMGAIRVGVTTAIDGESRRPYLRSKLLDLVLVVSVGFLLVLSFALSLLAGAVSAMSEALTDALGLSGPGQSDLLAAMVPLVLSAAICLTAYRYLPVTRPAWGAIGVATVLVVIATQVVAIGLRSYLIEIAQYDLVYGSLGSIFGFLFAVYLISTVFLLGAQVVHAWPLTSVPGPPSLDPLAVRIRNEIRSQLGLRRPPDDADG